MQVGAASSLGGVQGLATAPATSRGLSGSGASAASTAKDSFGPGASAYSASAYDSYARPSSRTALTDEQLMAKRTSQRRLAKERHALAVKKSDMYVPGPAMPLPVSSPGSVMSMAVPVAAAVGAGALAASALDKKEQTKPVETPKELPKEPPKPEEKKTEEAKPQEPPVINYTPPEQNITIEQDEEGNIVTDAAGLVWDGVTGTAGLVYDGVTTVGGLAWDGVSLVGGVAYDATGAVLGVPMAALEGAAFGGGFIIGPALAATAGTAYLATGGASFSPIVGAGIIADGAVTAGSAIAQGAATYGPLVGPALEGLAVLAANPPPQY